MKLKQVCEETGLSRKTIRLYEEKGLIDPRKERMNGRDYREYSPQDVERLRMIAMLRRAWFTMDEIRQMQEDPEMIRVIFPQYRQWLRQQRRDLEKLLAVADAVNLGEVADVFSLTEHMAEAAEHLPLPRADVVPHFKYLDEIEEVRNMKAEKESEYWQAPLEGGIKDDRTYRQFVANSSKTYDDNLAVAFSQFHEAMDLEEESRPVDAKRDETGLVRLMSRISGVLMVVGAVAALFLLVSVHLDLGILPGTEDITGLVYLGLVVFALGFVGSILTNALAAWQERQRWIQKMRQQDEEKARKR